MQANDDPAQGGLAAAGLAHHTQGGPFRDREGQILHRVELSPGRFEIFAEMADFDYRFHWAFPSFAACPQWWHLTRWPDVTS